MEAFRANRFALADRRLAEALALDPTREKAAVHRALILWERDHQASSALDTLAALPETSLTWQVRGALLARLGAFDAARDAAERSLALDPMNAVTLLHLSSLGPVEPGDPLFAAGARIAGDPDLPLDTRSAAHFALGKAFEDIGDAEKAVRHIQLANDFVAKPPPEDHSRAALTRARRLYPLVRPPELPAKGPRMVFIVGMPRSGTTMLERMLGAHPRVAMAGERVEGQRLARAFLRQAVDGQPDLPAIAAMEAFHTAKNLSLLRDSYLQRVAPKPWPDVLTDKHMMNFWHIGVLALAFPDALFLHLRRDPLDCCWSCYRTAFRSSFEFTASQGRLGAYYRDYHGMMAHWRGYLGPRLIELDYEALVTAPEAVLPPVVERLGLDWDPGCLSPDRTEGAIATASAWQARQPLYESSIGASRPLAPWLGPLIEALGGLHRG